jgi:hypothetical protein
LVGEMLAVELLLPPVEVPPLVSFVAPVTTLTVVLPDAVGVPETGHDMLAPGAIVAGAMGVHAPTVTPGGSPVIAQLAASALPVAVALFVHLTTPE